MIPFELDRLQHIGAKVFLSRFPPDGLDLCIPIFHRWIQQDACPELLIDVADYRHLPVGPGVILVAHEANYSLDRTRGRLGLSYQRKTTLEDSFEAKLKLSLQRAYEAARRLEQEQELRGRLAFDFLHWEIVFNDRLLAPNRPQNWTLVTQRLTELVECCWPGTQKNARFHHPGEPRDLLRVEWTLPQDTEPAAAFQHFLDAFP
ncbi:MAG: hypothetical protein RMI94_05005 [Bryobacterales bacterium]|nr:hypothetical protein [Bryobacteraceae bacterium]MDW8129886.1 hypothetical protein [Bryobacterales bacterium]